GDAGSHLVGYLLAVLAIWPQSQGSAPRGFLLPEGYSRLPEALFILAIPLSDLLSVVVIRWRQGRPFYLGDNNHFSHRSVGAGLSPARAVTILWLMAALLATLAVWWAMRV